MENEKIENLKDETEMSQNEGSQNDVEVLVSSKNTNENQNGKSTATPNGFIVAGGKAVAMELPETLLEESALIVERPTIIYKLSDFEGPLDLLLTLIKEAKISIDEIFVSDVTKQYIEIIKSTPREEFDFEYAGEFIIMAAELIYIKSLRTLPQEEYLEEEDDPELLKQAFILKAREYALLKEQAEKLKTIETVNRFYREPVYTEKDCRIAITNFSLAKLVDAFAYVLVNSEKLKAEDIPKTVMKERFSVHDQMHNILRIVLDAPTTFFSLFESDFDRSDIVTTFLAILELMKYQKIKAEQNELTHDIEIVAVTGNDGAIIFEEDDNGEY